MHAIWEWFTGWGGWHEVGTGALWTAAWAVMLSLVVVGLIGCVIPALPGHVFILLAAVAFRLILGPDSGVEWWTFAVLIGLLAASQAFEFLSGAVGTKWFGGSRWGGAGALLGGIVGMFFMPFGLLLGPLIGTFVFEMLFAKKFAKSVETPPEASPENTEIVPGLREPQRLGMIQKAKSAGVSGVGSVFGVLSGLVVKLIVGILMTLWLFIDIFWVG
jgi:uncharacterized protein YqgC (DUF456 family)